MKVKLFAAARHLARDGYIMLAGVFASDAMALLAEELSASLEDRRDPAVLRSRGRAYASRNLLETYPEVAALLRQPRLLEIVHAVLSPEVGIVRVLYFDKPPERSWSVPWHKDRTIAVKRNDLPSESFRHPTIKAGIPHVEAPTWLLENMLTLRVHLDRMTDANGPLAVIPGSRVVGDAAENPPVSLRAEPGDVLAMRPLLSHSSGKSRPGATMHRRLVHFELAAIATLADGYECGRDRHYWRPPAQIRT